MAGKMAKSTGGLVPGEIIPAEGDIEINVGARSVTVVVANTGDRPIRSAVTTISSRRTRA